MTKAIESLSGADQAAVRTGIGLGTAATQASTAFATAAQGTKADTALQKSSLAPSSQLIIGLGDSLTANGVSLTAGAPQYTVASALNWGCALLKQAVWMPVGITSAWSSGPADIVNYCLAVSGVTSAHVLNSQVPAARLLRAGWWSVQCGTNDLTILSGDSVSTICGRIRSIVEAGIDAGVRIALWTVPPRSDSQWSASSGLISAGGSTIAAQRAKHVALNNWIRRYAQETPGVVLIDPFSDLVEAASSTADWLANYAPDGTHWGTRGAFVAGRVFARAMAPFVKEVSSGSLSQLDVYDATLNPEGNLLPVSMFTMQGTSGSIGGTGVSGTVPTGWTQDLETGTLTPGTAALVAQARSDALAGGREIQITFGGSAPGNFTLRFYGAAASVPANGRFFAEVEYSANITAGGLRGVELLAFTQSGSPSVFPAAFAPDTTAIPAGVSFDAVARTPIVSSSGAISNLLMIRVNGAANVAGTVRIRRVNVRLVDSGSLGLLLGA